MDAQHRDPSQINLTELQATTTQIAIGFRQLLGFVESRNENPHFLFSHVKSNFETAATSLATGLDTLLACAHGADPALRDRCTQLSRLLRAITDDVRRELVASSPSPSGPATNLAARLPRSTAEAVGLIKSILASVQTSASPSLLSPLSLVVPSSTPPAHSNPAQSLRLSSTSTNFSQRSSLSRTVSSPHYFRSPSSSPTGSPGTSTPSPTNFTPAVHPASSVAQPEPSPAPAAHTPNIGLFRSVSAPHHAVSPPPLSASAPSFVHSSSLSALPPSPTSPRERFTVSSSAATTTAERKSPRIAVVPLLDGTTSHPTSPSPPSAMILLVDKRTDPALAKLAKTVLSSISWVEDTSLKTKLLAFFVGSALGKVPVGDFDVCRNCAQLRGKYGNDPCPIGEISQGFARHRVLLYKYLADSISLPARIHTHASVLRPPYEVSQEHYATLTPSPSISVVEVYVDAMQGWCVVDLVKDVGELYEENSQRANEYRLTSMEWEDESPPTTAVQAIKDGSGSSSTGGVNQPTDGETKHENNKQDTSNGESDAGNVTDDRDSGNVTGSDSSDALGQMSSPAVENKRMEAIKAGRSRSNTTGGSLGGPPRVIRNNSHTKLQYTPASPSPSSHSPTTTPGTTGTPTGTPTKPGKPVVPSRVLRAPTENTEIILNERVGKGTFGDVYRCRISGYTCAVKIVNIKSLSEAALKMMHNEIHFLETLQHENIIGFLGHEELPRREIKIFMEFMPISLASIIQKRNTTSSYFHKRDIIKCAKGMAEALSYLHHRKIIHRDIKSSNVLLEIDMNLDRVQEIRLCDFGVSKAMSENVNASTFTGTNLWVAPEVFDVQFGIASTYDEMCDIWSFGMVLVEMATLNPPYVGLSSQQATQNIRNGIPPSLESNPNIDRSISNLIYSCLKKLPSERPSANEIIGILNQL